MTEIPEHLRTRADEARKTAEAKRGESAAPAADAAPAEAAAAAPAGDSRIPAHLLERSRAAKDRAAGAGA
ncbi:MAG TPA: hypothetical protein VK866_13335, partial [Acidimicrobiales bacterium]|nr:hypothetical protein [Acidimicrobiales bacterium]